MKVDKQEIKGGGNKMLNSEADIREIKECHEPYVKVSGNRELSNYIRNSLTRLDMLIYLDRKDEAQAEIQAISDKLEKMGI
ncbi:MAG: hypothetical protein RQ824_00655 [bacterium]|nr:hypothetical protein [bacterium]